MRVLRGVQDSWISGWIRGWIYLEMDWGRMIIDDRVVVIIPKCALALALFFCMHGSRGVVWHIMVRIVDWSGISN